MKYIRSLIILNCLFFFVAISQQNDVTVYVTRTGSKYHAAGCRYLSKSKIPMTLSEASERYSPCSVCNPPLLSAGSLKRDKITPQDNSSLNHSNENAVGVTPTGKTIYEGPRGGKYHYSKSGKKVYEKKRK